jgi:hypothetical protein
MSGHRTPEPRQSKVNASELVATFTDYDERSAPYEARALRIRLSSDVLFVYVGKLDESEVGVERFQYDDKMSVGVDAETLYHALGAMLRRSDRNAYERLREGTLPADHPSLISANQDIQTPAVRVRA